MAQRGLPPPAPILPCRAGTENSPTWPGFYEGAVTSGEEAARTVGGLLRREKRAK